MIHLGERTYNILMEFGQSQLNQDSLELNGTHLLLAYADVNILGGSIHTIKENSVALIVASKEIGLEVTI
jgi:hypothetical protein